MTALFLCVSVVNFFGTQSMAKQLLYTDDARKKLLTGAEKLARAGNLSVEELRRRFA